MLGHSQVDRDQLRPMDANEYEAIDWPLGVFVIIAPWHICNPEVWDYVSQFGSVKIQPSFPFVDLTSENPLLCSSPDVGLFHYCVTIHVLNCFNQDLPVFCVQGECRKTWVALPREVAAACGGSRLLASMRPTVWISWTTSSTKKGTV